VNHSCTPPSLATLCRSALLIFALLLTGLTTQAQTTRYVSTTGTNTNPASATSWATSTTNLQGAIDASGVTQVWVATGIYRPTTVSTNRGASFAMKNGVAIYGGFVGTETALTDRPAINPVSGSPSSSTLSGDIDNSPADNTDNSRHVIFNPPGLTTTAILDGLVITGGNADGSSPDNVGGGMYNNGSGSGNVCSPSLTNCSFQGNTASGQGGGAMFNSAVNGGISSPV